MRRLFTSLVALTVLASAGGCSAVGGSGTYKVTVFFEKTPSLYEKSRVKVMGDNVGGIDDISVDEANNRVKVTLHVRSDVPVPADAHAAIVSANTIGERNVVLYPPWKPGMPKIADGAVIPQERTDLPVEIDDALTAFTALAESIDPATLRQTFAGGAALVNDNGPKINNALKQIGDLSNNLAAQDERLISLAGRLNDLAKSLNERDKKLKALFTAFNDAGGLLAEERNNMVGFLSGLEAIIRQGDVLVETYHKKLPSTVAEMSEIVMTLKANSGSMAQAIEQFAKFNDTAVKIWDRKRHLVTVRLQMSAITRAWLQPIFTAMGWGPVDCPRNQFSNCDGTTKDRNAKTKKKKKAGAP